jgi:hypothetical protein
MNKLKNFLVSLKNSNPWLLFLWHEQLRYRGIINLKNVSDLDAIRNLYFNFSGKYPNIDNPKTFGEKQQWLKLNYHNPLMTRCADKYEVRAFLKEKGYESILSEVIGFYQSIENLDLDKLPSKFVLKASHGSGWNLICKDKTKISWQPWKLVMGSWLKSNIYWLGREWPYKDMRPGIICEEYMEDKSGQLMDYKFFCFNNEPKFIQANKGRGTNKHAQNFYDLDWHILPFGKELEPLPDVEILKPSCFQQMLNIAKDLSQYFPFVRVDLYEVDNKVIFGELTFYPKSGLPDFTPPKYDSIIGEMLELPK